MMLTQRITPWAQQVTAALLQMTKLDIERLKHAYQS